NWDSLLKGALAHKIVYQEISKFPPVERDLAFVVAKNISWGKIENAIYSTNIGKLTEVKLFDIFESEKIGADKKSVAVNFTFSDEEKTLTDKEVERFMRLIATALENEAGAEVRS